MLLACKEGRGVPAARNLATGFAESEGEPRSPGRIAYVTNHVL
jgi:hypothetical protein